MNKHSISIKIKKSISTGILLFSVGIATNAFATYENQISDSTTGSTATDLLLFNTQIQNTASGLNGHISSAIGATGLLAGLQTDIDNINPTGLNAGELFSVPYSIWGNYAYTDFENDLSTTAFDGQTHGFLGGIDFLYWDSAIFGIAFGYDNSDIDTTFNRGNQNTDTFTFAPYFGAILTDNLSVDFSFGYSNADFDQYRTAGTTRINSSPDADRWFGSINLNAIKMVDNWIFGGRIGALYASSVIDSYTESNNTVVARSRTKVGTMSFATDIAYGYGNFEPFLNLAYNYDFSLKNITTATAPAPANDKNDILFSAGVRYFEKSGISGNLEYSKRLLREDFDEDRISLTIRIDY